ncbi:putative RNA-directed DNA polymerase [Helianthus annuus]|nr:putative RNA-directed DNA polymerase [Helianthus annuus]KAJ0766822.1 putative RNA-directed DNA polymerase [Helianthus annuus]
MIIESQTPQYFWPEAIATSVYLLNRLPTQILKHKTPLQTLASQVPIPSVLTLLPRVFGCTVYVHIPKSDRNKLEPCAEKCLFVGYATHQKRYRCYNPVTRRIHVTMDCDFLESEFYFSDQSSIPGERVRESLDWLSALSCSDQSADVVLTEQVDGATESLTTNIERADKPVYTANESTSDDVQQEVNESSDIFSNDSNNINSHDDSPVPEIEPEEPQPRVLPARKNRGVPADRYSPEHVSRSSRYPVNVDRGRVADIAKAFSATLLSENIPKTAQEASKKIEWQEAMNTEVKALIKNGTWEKCVLPAGKKPVGCRWVFTIKYKADGTIERYKARLVAKGYTQTYGIDYSETFSPVAKINTIRVLFSVAANKDWPLHQFDVKNAFLHGNLEEEVYMEAPPGFSDGFRKNEVCKLKKALYGLKQSPRAWFGRFTMAMKRYGYKQSNADHTLFLKRRGDLVTCLIIYVDDIIITGSDEEEIVLLRKNLFKEFEIKDLGGLKYFLGIEVLRSKEGIFISQRKYILDLLAETGMVDCKPSDTPMIVNQKLKIIEGTELADRERYQRLVGKLIYLAHTRPDIAYAVVVVSQFMHQPQLEHMEAVMRIIRYLKGTPGRGIVFKNNGHLDVKAFTDADWAGNPNDRRSTAGFFTLVGGNLVTWRSKKQKVVSLSSAESEFRGIVKGITEILWLKKLMNEIGFPLKLPTQLMCDNKAAIKISENPVQHDRTKHVEIDRHFIKEKIEDGTVELPFIRSEEQLADILTKVVATKTFEIMLCKLGIADPTTQLEGEC